MINVYVPVMGSISTRPVEIMGSVDTWTPQEIVEKESYYALWVIDPDVYSDPIAVFDRTVAGDTVNIYDFEPGTENYKISKTGDWVSGTGETFNMRTFKDQSGNGVDIDYSAGDMPQVLLNQDLGSPVFVPVVGSDVLGVGTPVLSEKTAFSIITRGKATTDSTGGVVYAEDGQMVGIQPYFEEVQ